MISLVIGAGIEAWNESKYLLRGRDQQWLIRRGEVNAISTFGVDATSCPNQLHHSYFGTKLEFFDLRVNGGVVACQ